MIKKFLSWVYYRLPAKFSAMGYAFPCRNVIFELVYSCNLDCEMCPYRKEVKYTHPEGTDLKPLSKDEIISLLHRLPKGSSVTFTGGEPFLKEGILDILKAAGELHKVTLATNGTLVTEKMAEKMVKWKIRLIGLSLDGPREIHNDIRRDPEAYDKLVEAIRKINRYKKDLDSEYPRLNLNCVILKKNAGSLYKNIELAKDLDVDLCTFQIFDPSWNRSGWRLSDTINASEKVVEEVERIDPKKLKSSLEQLVSIAKSLKVDLNFIPPLSLNEIVDYYDRTFKIDRWHCFQPWSTMRISPYGDVFPCLNFSIGNIREKKMAALWNNSSYRDFRKTLGRAILFDSCVGCCKMTPRRRKHENSRNLPHFSSTCWRG